LNDNEKVTVLYVGKILERLRYSQQWPKEGRDSFLAIGYY